MTSRVAVPDSSLDPGTRRMLARFAPMIYGPTLLFGLGEGALLPLLPVIAAGLGADVAQAALIAAVIVFARLIGNLPAGWLVARIGERRTMAIAGCLALAGGVGVLLAPTLALLAVAVFFIGLCAAAFGLARHAFMTTRVPLHYRARALSVLGGDSEALWERFGEAHRLLLDWIPRAEGVVLPGVTHFMQLQDPAGIAAALAAFWARHPIQAAMRPNSPA